MWENGHLQGMLVRELQTSTLLGNGIAIPHGTLDTRSIGKENEACKCFNFLKA